MWMYFNKDPNPTQQGFYWCTMIADITKNGEPTGKKVAYADLRCFDDVTNVSETYRMKGQPLKGMGWIRDADGFQSETLYAWSPDQRNGVCDTLPDGVIVIKMVDHDD